MTSMFESFHSVDRSAHGRRAERLNSIKSYYNLEDSSHLSDLLGNLTELAGELGLVQMRIYDCCARAFSSPSAKVREEPLMLDVFRTRLYNPPSQTLQLAHEAVGVLLGTLQRQDPEGGFVVFDEEGKAKIKLLMELEQKETDALGVHIVLPPSIHRSGFRTYLDEAWGITETDPITIVVPYDPDLFRRLCTPSDQLNVC